MTLPSTSSIASRLVTCSRSTRTSWSRASRAASACRTARPTGSPGLEAASPRGRIAAMRAVELDGAPIDDAFRRTRWRVRAVPRLRDRLPVGGAVRPPHGGIARVARATRPPRRACRCGASPSGSDTWWCCRVIGCCSRSRGPLWLGQRLRLVPRRFGLPKISLRSLRDPPRRRRGPSRRVICSPDASWTRGNATSTAPRSRSCAPSGAHPGLPERGGDCCGALHIHAGRVHDARRLARRVDRVDARATRPSSSTARAAARR